MQATIGLQQQLLDEILVDLDMMYDMALRASEDCPDEERAELAERFALLQRQLDLVADELDLASAA